MRSSFDPFPFISLQTVALWLRNTDYIKHHGICLLGLQVEAFVQKVKLFQRKTVHEILWGYSDSFLEFLKHPPLDCPGQDGLSSFVQLQVCEIVILHWTCNLRIL